MRLQVKSSLRVIIYTTKINFKAFTIPILTVIRMEIANALELIFVVYIITLELNFNL